MMKFVIFALFALLSCGSAYAQGNQCRTATVGASTPNCASEAFVTESISAIPPPSGGTVTEQKNTAGTGLSTSGNCDNTSTNASSPCQTALSVPVSVANGGTGDTGTAWGSYTASPVCVTGSGTWVVNSAKFKQLGKSVFFEGDFSLSAIGTCSGTPAWNFTLPTTANSGAGAAGRETAISGFDFTCVVNNASNSMQCQATGGSWASGNRVRFSGVYESQ